VPSSRDNVEVFGTAVRSALFHALAYNKRLHVVFAAETGAGPIRYTVDDGSGTKWFTPADVGFNAASAPQLVALADNLFVVGIDGDGRIHYSRRDPNRIGPENTGVNSSTLWLSKGQSLDPLTARNFAGIDTIYFNGDVYLAAHCLQSDPAKRGVYLINVSRAAIKQLISGKWGIKLRYGETGGAVLRVNNQDVIWTKGSEIPGVGDVDGDGEDDLIRFTQKSESGVGPAPVYVARGGEWVSKRWHTFFSLKGEIPLVGDFDRDGDDDIVTFVQKRQNYANGTLLGNAPVWVSLSDRTKFQTSRVWHTFFSLKGEIPLVGDFDGDRRDDIVTFVQKRQNYADGSILGNAPVWVALSDGTRFGQSRVWHTFFSLKGEIPAVGDFNGDGKDDIATFVQKPYRDANGNLIATAPVWVALSNGTRFLPSRIWHNFFAPKGEVPLVGDFNLDGVDDIATLLHDRVTGDAARNVFVALSNGSSFGRSSLWASDFAGKDETPFVANFGGRLKQITDRDADKDKKTADLVSFNRSNGRVRLTTSMGTLPYPAGAPWERYKWFTAKGLGVTEFPEFIFQRSGHCISTAHRFVLQGAGGSGGPDVTNLSVRIGSRAGHVLEELGHSFFANCFRKTTDPLNAGIYGPTGVDTNNLWGGGPQSSIDCPGGQAVAKISIPPPVSNGQPFGFYDCRNDIAEHYFLALLIHYRLDGDEFRALIMTTTDPVRQARLRRQYEWIKANWFQGAAFKRGPAVNGNLTSDGLLCLAGECSLDGPIR
jgi:hypothetical protein